MKWINTIAIATLLYSCTSEFDEINTPPDNASSVAANFLMAESQYETFRRLIAGMQNSVTNNATTYYFKATPWNRWGNEASAGTWQDFYVECLKPLQDIHTQYGDDPTHHDRLAMTDIWMSYLYWYGVTTWGPIPYSEALTGEQFIKYDSEDSIYIDLLTTLKASSDSLDNPTGDIFIPDVNVASGDGNSTASYDIIFDNDIISWQKFANSLRLRIATQLFVVKNNLSPALSAMVDEVVAEVLADPLIVLSNNGENVDFPYVNNGVNDDANPLFQAEQANPENNFELSVSETMIGYLRAHDDPRMFVYALPSEVTGEYEGRPINHNELPTGLDPLLEDSIQNANPHQGRGEYREYATIGTRFTQRESPFRIFHYDEILFSIAEILYWSSDPVGAEQYYLLGIRAAMEKLQLDPLLIENYLTASGVAPNTITSDDKAAEFENWLYWLDSETNVKPSISSDLYQKIVVQRWLASYPETYDMWSFLKRTEDLSGMSRPKLYRPASTNPFPANVSPYIRLPYPTEEFILNREGYEDGLRWLGLPAGSIDGMYEKLLYIP